LIIPESIKSVKFLVEYTRDNFEKPTESGWNMFLPPRASGIFGRRGGKLGIRNKDLVRRHGEFPG